ncbi:ribonuclease H-like domain-containing protein [Tanacetum coccineum]
MAFVSSNNTTSTTETDNNANGVNATHTQVNTVNSTSVDNLSDVVICAFLSSQPNSSQLAKEDLEQIDPDDLEEMDLHWEMAMLTIRARRFMKRIGRNLDMNGQRIGFDRSKVECFNCHKHGHFARECRASKNQEYIGREYGRKIMPVETTTENALIAQDGIGGNDWSYQTDEEHPTNFVLMAYTSSGSSSSLDSEFNLVSYKAGLQSVEERLVQYKKNEIVLEEKINVLNLEVKLRDNALVENQKKLEKAESERDELKLTLEKFQSSSKSLNNLLDSQVSGKSRTGLGYSEVSPEVESFVNEYNMLKIQENNKFRSDEGYHAVPPPYSGNFMPPKPDLRFIDEQLESEFMDVVSNEVNTVESNLQTADTGVVETNTVRKNSFGPPIIEDWNSNDDREEEFTPNKTVRPSIKFVKSAKETVEEIGTPKQNKNHPRGNQRNWNNLIT